MTGASAPGFAQELHRADFPILDALTISPVPTLADVPTSPPAIVSPQQEMLPTAVATPELEEDFDSLAEAVAAQDAEVVDDEMRCLAAGVYYESKGEPLAGQLAVAQTIINRTKSGRFPKSICSVLTQAGQFSFVRGGVVPSAVGRSGWNTAVAVAKVAYADLWDGAAEKALYFHARRVAPGWRMQKVAAIGNHVFYR